MRTQLLLTILLAAPTTVGCGSLYGSYEDDVEYVEAGDEALADDAPAVSDVGGEPAVAEEAYDDAGEDVASVDVFYDALDEHGVWQQDPEYGYIFAPAADDYVPYSDGYWVETEYGQTWVATDAIGWAVCHYGRWIYRDRWLWIPGTVWGPSWVDWRIGGGWVGWAPLGFGSYSVPYYSWRFVSHDHLYAHDLRSHYRRVHEVRNIHPQTHRVDRYIRGRDGRRYVAGPAHVGRGGARPAPVRLRDLPARATGRFAARAERADRAERGRRSDSRHPGYRASRAHSERMSRAGLDRSRRDVRYRAPTRRYSEPTHRYSDPPRRGDPGRRYDTPRRQPAPRAYAPGRSNPRALPSAGREAPRRSLSRHPSRSPRSVPTYRGGGSRRGQPGAGSASPRRAPSKARSDSRRSSPRSGPVRGGGSRGPSKGSTGRRGR